MLTKNSNSKIVRKLTKKKQKKKGSESDGLGWEKSHDSSEGLISPGRDSNPTFEDLNLPSLTDSGDREITKEMFVLFFVLFFFIFLFLFCFFFYFVCWGEEIFFVLFCFFFFFFF